MTVEALLRKTFWRLALAGRGGLRVDGRLPDGGCVVVANHTSHADTAALLAALPARRRPAVAAAADYWFAGRRRALLCRALAGGFPVRRGGGGTGDLAAATALLSRGQAVIVYPEGTRSRDGSLGDFRAGALRLAEAAGVPLVPVGISGTGALLPVHGRPARAPVRVRIGSPTTDLAAARAQILTLSSTPPSHRAPARESAVRQHLAELADSGPGLVCVGVWAVAEALVLPLLPEFLLAVLVVAAPRRAPRLALVAAVGSLAGGALGYLLAARGVAVPLPLTTPRMRETAAAQVDREGAAAVAHQAMSGIPYKVYAAASGRAHTGLGRFLLASVPDRSLRILLVGLGCAALGALTRRWRRFYTAYLALFVTVFAAGLAVVVASWS